jgi:hypothetical protein
MRECDDGSREQSLKDLALLKQQNQALVKSIGLYEKCDPKRLEEIKSSKQVCIQGVTRWTDNLYVAESWMRKNNAGMTKEALDEQFPILKDLDYMAMDKE